MQKHGFLYMCVYIYVYVCLEHQPVVKLINNPVMAQPMQPMALKYR